MLALVEGEHVGEDQDSGSRDSVDNTSRLAREAVDIAAALRAIGRLTSRERDVFELLGFGLSNRSIAYRLGLSEPRIKAHITQILRKLDVRSRTQAAIVAFAHQCPAPDTKVRVPGQHGNQ